jgi:GntR family transcriptional regulator, transcriptional repressor for pyruvate dehydrogenase complex
MFKPLTHKRFSDQIVAQIMQLIKEGQLKPGDTLPSERKMAQNFGVSRPPLREALKTLEAMGFLEILQRHKVRVKSFAGPDFYTPLAKALDNDAGMVFQLLEIRKIFESWAASTASQVATEEEIRELEEIYEEIKNDFDKDKLGVDADVKLHLAIYRATHNTVLAHLAFTLLELLRQAQTVTRRVMLADEDNKAALLKQHASIVEAIKERNPRKARNAAISHLKFAERYLKKHYLKASDTDADWKTSPRESL